MRIFWSSLQGLEGVADALLPAYLLLLLPLAARWQAEWRELVPRAEQVGN